MYALGISMYVCSALFVCYVKKIKRNCKKFCKNCASDMFCDVDFCSMGE